MHVFAQSGKEVINQWLTDHPVALGAGALVLGLVLVGLGASALLTGRAVDKRGRRVEGGQAKLLAVVWLAFGTACLLFGAYKVVSGLL